MVAERLEDGSGSDYYFQLTLFGTNFPQTCVNHCRPTRGSEDTVTLQGIRAK